MNHLGGELSPYLRQHRDNPVDWYPWGEAAFARARELGRPVFISIGYSACHWCHVMAHETFEDETIAQRLNGAFVAVKVDREERPDVDAVYIESVQALTGQAGWPLSVFATPGGRPFFGGTYFPPRAAHGLPGFAEVLDAVADAWANRRAEIEKNATELTAAVQASLAPAIPGASAPGAAALLDAAVKQFAANHDADYGGFGREPKFPQAPMLELLWRAAELGRPRAAEMAALTIEAMASGGIYDHLGGGFARYSTDRRWLVPHFEKMAYDQATLSRCYLHAWQITATRAGARCSTRPSATCSGSCATPPAAFGRRRTPTPKVPRGASTSGPPTSSPPSWAPRAAPSPPSGSASPRRAISRTGTASCTGRCAATSCGRPRSSAAGPSSAGRGPDGSTRRWTTRCSPSGTP